MFDALMSKFIKDKKADAPPVNSGVVRPNVEPVRIPEPEKAPAAEIKALPQAIIQERPPAIQLPAVPSEPAEDVTPSMPLPEGIDPGQVSVMRRDAKKTGDERFKYTDKPLKPLSADGKKAEVIKYNDKGANNLLKYQTASVTPRTGGGDHERKGAEVFKYTPARVELKN